MKRFVYISIISCLMSFSFLNTAQSQLHFVLQSGIVFSKAIMTSHDNNLWELDYAYSGPNLNYVMTNATNLYVSYSFTHLISLTLEPGYIQKSNELNGGLTYIQLPVLADYNVIDRLHLTAGPELNFLLNNDSQNSYEELDMALQLGAYYGASSTFDIGFKYSRSFNKFLKDDIVSSGEDINFYHQYFQFFTRYKF